MDKGEETPTFKRISKHVPDHLPEYFVWWDAITQTQIDDFRQVLDRAANEHALQAYIQADPYFIIQHLGGGHGRWVIPQKRLGAEHVTDFVIGEKHSFGFDWVAVEIESPHARLFTKRGDPTAKLSHAIRQVEDWRAWLKRNQNYASQSKENAGLGLTDIDCTLKGLIVIGRRNLVEPNTHELRRQLCSNLNIDIHTYDWLVEQASGRVMGRLES